MLPAVASPPSPAVAIASPPVAVAVATVGRAGRDLIGDVRLVGDRLLDVHPAVRHGGLGDDDLHHRLLENGRVGGRGAPTDRRRVRRTCCPAPGRRCRRAGVVGSRGARGQGVGAVAGVRRRRVVGRRGRPAEAGEAASAERRVRARPARGWRTPRRRWRWRGCPGPCRCSASCGCACTFRPVLLAASWNTSMKTSENWSTVSSATAVSPAGSSCAAVPLIATGSSRTPAEVSPPTLSHRRVCTRIKPSFGFVLPARVSPDQPNVGSDRRSAPSPQPGYSSRRNVSFTDW